MNFFHRLLVPVEAAKHYHKERRLVFIVKDADIHEVVR